MDRSVKWFVSLTLGNVRCDIRSIVAVLDLVMSYFEHSMPLALHVGLVLICSILGGLRGANIRRVP